MSSREDDKGDGVLSNLPSTRPQRRSTKRAPASAESSPTPAPAGKAATHSTGAAAKAARPSARTPAKAAARGASAPAKTSQRAKTSQPAKTSQRAETSQRASAPARAATTKSGAQKPAPPSEVQGARGVAAQGFEALPPSQVSPPSNTEILVSAVRAAGELAQVGLSLGEYAARAAARRLKP